MIDEKFIYGISADHPSLAGHFPGKPVVPGVVALEEICHQIATRFNGCSVEGINKLKFLQPLLPEVKVQVHCKSVKGNALRIRCADLATGNVKMDAHVTLASAPERG